MKFEIKGIVDCLYGLLTQILSLSTVFLSTFLSIFFVLTKFKHLTEYFLYIYSEGILKYAFLFLLNYYAVPCTI